ncbi:HRSL1 enzyme, partial [Erpornis zantholeuca]|nr:HRSL1 enzyme [Erpornis zantholeuca]
DPKPGDLIEIKRPGYRHWALYVGDGYVIHVTSTGESSSSFSIGSARGTKGIVKKELLYEVVGDNKWRVNNKYDRIRNPLPVEEIIKEAESWIDKEVPYNLLVFNCEHFVTMLRYSVGVSGQVS